LVVTFNPFIFVLINLKNNLKQTKMKATQLTQKQVDKIVYALKLAYGDSDYYDAKGMKLMEQLTQAKAVITAK